MPRDEDAMPREGTLFLEDIILRKDTLLAHKTRLNTKKRVLIIKFLENATIPRERIHFLEGQGTIL